MADKSPGLYPDVTLGKCLESLNSRYNVKAERMAPMTKIVRVEILLPDGIPHVLWLTEEQLRFTVMRHVSNAGLVAESFPSGWPLNPGRGEGGVT